MTSRHSNRGQATVEYLVVTMALATALWLPIDGSPLAQRLLDVLARTYRNYVYVVAVL